MSENKKARQTCRSCSYFLSFYEAYDQDGFEPQHQGFCKHPDINKDGGKKMDTAGVSGQGCCDWKRR